MKINYGIEQINDVVQDVMNRDRKIIYIAGASASGKSYFAEKLKEELEKKGKKVLALSSDNYYVNNTRLKHLIYGTFDHPKLIRYDELAHDIRQFIKTDSIKIPSYSFIDSRRNGSTTFTGKVDYIIVEGLYTINSLPNFNKDQKPVKIFVDSPTEELIMRRLIRDQERTKQSIDAIIGDITKVFPMWNIYGKTQKNLSDIVIHNDYEILAVKGEKRKFEKTDKTKKDLGILTKKEHYIDFEYNDTIHDNGTIVISEVYQNMKDDLDYVIISKRKNDGSDNKDHFTIMSVRSTQLGIITQIHNLMQTAGLQILKIDRKTVETYDKDGKCCIIKERKGKRYMSI